MSEFVKYSSDIIQVADKASLLNTPGFLTPAQEQNITNELAAKGWIKGETWDKNTETGYVGQAYVNNSQKLIIIDSRCAEAVAEIKNTLSSVVNSIDLNNLNVNEVYALATAIKNAPNTSPDLKSALDSLIDGRQNPQAESARVFLDVLAKRSEYAGYKFVTTAYCNGAPAAYTLALENPDKVLGSITFSGIGISEDTAGANTYNPNFVNITYDSDPFVNYDFQLAGVNIPTLSDNLVHPGTNIILNNGSLNLSTLSGYLSILSSLNAKLDEQGINYLFDPDKINIIAKTLGKTPDQVYQSLDGSINQLVNILGSGKVKQLNLEDDSSISVQNEKGTIYSIAIDNGDNLLLRVKDSFVELYDNFTDFLGKTVAEGKEFVDNLKNDIDNAIHNFKFQLSSDDKNLDINFNSDNSVDINTGITNTDDLKALASPFALKNLDTKINVQPSCCCDLI